VVTKGRRLLVRPEVVTFTMIPIIGISARRLN